MTEPIETLDPHDSNDTRPQMIIAKLNQVIRTVNTLIELRNDQDLSVEEKRLMQQGPGPGDESVC